MIPVKTVLNCKGKLLDLTMPQVMGIINVTPDSFYDGGRIKTTGEALSRAEQMLREGATILDVGGASTKPGAAEVQEDEELKRVLPLIEGIRKNFPEAIISIDTWRSRVAEEAVHAGAGIVNDISAGSLDAQLLPTVAKLKTAYVLMHMQGTPETMQRNPIYKDAVREVFDFLKNKLLELNRLGIYDVIVDPGFGFGKTVDHNFQLLSHLDVFRVLGAPLMAGVSRKSMICRALHIKPDAALNGTTALNTVALLKGASLLRVHDVKEAREVVQLIQRLHDA